MKFRIRCTVYVDVDLDVSDGTDPKFFFEDNGCPGTGTVGRAIEDATADARLRGICWACKLGGTNEIVKVLP